jgi:hypothetical protein
VDSGRFYEHRNAYSGSWLSDVSFCAHREPPCAHFFTGGSEVGALAGFVPGDGVWPAAINRGWGVTSAFQVAADHIVAHVIRCGSIAAEIDITVNARGVDPASATQGKSVVVHRQITVDNDVY